MRHRPLLAALVPLAIAMAVLTATLVAGNEPVLGLDLQGGISVVLTPTEDDVDEERLSEAVRIIRLRIDSLGVAEPEISVQGDSILVQLPGIEDRERALSLVGGTAELRFRPVRSISAGALDLEGLSGIEGLEGIEGVEGIEGIEGLDDLEGVIPTGETNAEEPGDSSEGAPPPATEPAIVEEAPANGSTSAESLGVATLASFRPPAQDPSPATTQAQPIGPPDTTTTSLPPLPPTTLAPPPLDESGLTPPEFDLADAEVTLAQLDEEGKEVARYNLGPTAMTGEGLNGARATLGPSSEWLVIPDVKSGTPGLDELNAVALQCYSQQPPCESGRLAIVLDGVVVSAPVIEESRYDQGLSISGDFTEREARDLATVLKFGALPVELEQEAVTSVSATIGEDALRAGLIAGLFGVFLAAAYLVAFYRLLGLLAMVSLAISGALLWSIISYLGSTRGLALTLAGVTGIIVSIGVSLDSNVVYFEHLKEDIRRGRSIRSAVDRSFDSAFSTIVKADIASLIGAGLLYLLTIGPVRGFALYLGLATTLDLITAYFFMRPATIAIGRWKRTSAHPARFGLPVVEPVAEATS